MVGDQSQRRWNPRDLWRVTWQTNTGRTAQHECKSQTARARIVRNRRSPSGSCNFAVFEKFTRTYRRNKKRAECIVELYKHARIFKNTREVQRSTSVLKNSQVLITQQCSRNEIFYFFYKCIVNFARSYRWRRLHALYLNSALVWRKARAYGNIMNSSRPIAARSFLWTFHNKTILHSKSCNYQYKFRWKSDWAKIGL